MRFVTVREIRIIMRMNHYAFYETLQHTHIRNEDKYIVGLHQRNKGDNFSIKIFKFKNHCQIINRKIYA